MDEAGTDPLARTSFPRAYLAQIYGTHAPERPKAGIQRHTKVLGISPGGAPIVLGLHDARGHDPCNVAGAAQPASAGGFRWR